MTLTKKALSWTVAVALLGASAVVAAAPSGVDAADHLDAPGLTSPSGQARLDINDLYVFEGDDPENTVLAMTINPAATGDTDFAVKRRGSYHIRIDQNGDGIEDVTYSFEFHKPKLDEQKVKVRRATGKSARSKRPRGRVIGTGWTNDTFALNKGAGQVFAGLRSDPFFFDLGGFLGTVEGIGARGFNDGSESDFFDSLNTLAIVIEVPDAWVGSNVGVWATTSGRWKGHRRQVDRIGRPAINTVVNSSGPVVGAAPDAKNVYNASQPRNDVANFTAAVVDALLAYSALDTEGPYTAGEAAALAGVLLPDVLTYDTSTSAAGPLNGRALADDVIDVELTIVTGGDPLGLFAGRDAAGGINGDGIGPHGDYLAVFPYLGEPH